MQLLPAAETLGLKQSCISHAELSNVLEQSWADPVPTPLLRWQPGNICAPSGHS